MIRTEMHLLLDSLLGNASMCADSVMRERTPGVEYEMGRFSAAGKGKG
jgi:hypothetical protein